MEAACHGGKLGGRLLAGDDCKRGDAGESLITDLTGMQPADGVRRSPIENKPEMP